VQDFQVSRASTRRSGVAVVIAHANFRINFGQLESFDDNLNSAIDGYYYN
jgi:hypothetical protein